MNKYTFSYGGNITVIAETEDEALELAEDILAPTAYASDHCKDISLYDIELTDVETEDT